ncbi:hypothetical protein, partial [Rhodoblastus sp.]|uniref:hypothetical protein n=1 Tax=Rhodoblastus sp. TaxID=1962975 RepID=UPI003FD7171A
RIPNESFGIRIPLARKSARDIEDFRAMAFPRIAKQSCGNRMIGDGAIRRKISAVAAVQSANLFVSVL